jgi:hypothetical protein
MCQNLNIKFTLCKSVHHLTIQINDQPDATVFQVIILTFVYRSTCFGRFPAHHQELNDCNGSLCFYIRIVVIVVLCSWSGRPAGPTIKQNVKDDFERPPHLDTVHTNFVNCRSCELSDNTGRKNRTPVVSYRTVPVTALVCRNCYYWVLSYL